MNSLLETEINESEVEILMHECHVTREYAIRILEEHAKLQREYLAYLESNLDPRD